MIKKHKKHLSVAKKSALVRAFRKLIPELIFKTTKLEGEPVTRKMVRSIFG